MKIYLIWPDNLERVKSNIYPPLGLGHLASVLKNNGFDVKILDLTFDPQYEQIRNITSKGNIYGISSTTYQFNFASHIARTIKEQDPASRIIFGGPHPSVLPEEVISKHSIDFVVAGEGEYVFLELVQSLGEKRSFSQIKGVYSKEGGKVNYIPRDKFIDNLDELPFPERRDFPLAKYFQVNGWRILNMVASRGCLYNCNFCQPVINNMFGNKVRYRSPQNIVGEIENLIKAFKIDSVTFKDDTFVSNEALVTEICKEIINRNINILWACQTRVGLKKEMIRLMKKSGCYSIAFGVESGSQYILDSMQKNINMFQIEETFRYCKEIGVLTHAYFMIGNPEESEQTIQDTIKLIKRIRTFSGHVFFTVPYPGTILHQRLEKSNRLNIASWDSYYTSSEVVLGLIKMNMPKGSLIAAKKEICLSIKNSAQKLKDMFLLLKDGYILRILFRNVGFLRILKKMGLELINR